ncbi:hypothetical protein [Actinophytocola glycyrrhizae]|uniref:PPE family protein n=1 Tax=Actinophytocola glycyrrhizae TaxID=2044873 RepID=A0ABV9RW78_9PSEU
MTWLPPSMMTGAEIYRNFQEGPGAEGISSSAALVNELAERHRERAGRVVRLRARMEAAWQGAAAGAANRGLGPLVAEHELSGSALHTAQDLTRRQAGSFGDARNTVVPVPPAPGEVDPLVLLTDHAVTATYFQQVAEHNQAAQHNVDVMNGYTGASEYNTDRQPASYGDIVDDQAALAVRSPDTIAVGESEERAAGADGPRGFPGTGPGETVRPGTSSDVDGGGRGSSPAGPGGTTPGSFVPAPSPGPGAGTEVSAAGGRSVPGMTGSGTGVPVVGGPVTGGVGGPYGSGAWPRGGTGAAPGGGSPRGGVPGGGPGAGAERPGAAGRAGLSVVPGPGRGGVGLGGVPLGAAGRGRGAEDTERKRPDYLEGGDPEELFDTDQLTAPSAIGDEDED